MIPHHRRPVLAPRTHRVASAAPMALAFGMVLLAASCSTLTADTIEAGAPAMQPTTPPTSPPPTSVPTTLPPATLAPTTLAPTTVAPATSVPTTVAPTSVAPTTVAPATVAPTTPVPTGADTSLPRTGRSDAAVFAIIGLAMILAGRSVLDLYGLLGRVRPTGHDLPGR